MSNIEEIKQNEFNQKVLAAKLPVLIDFYADWCGPCKTLGIIVEKTAKKHKGKVGVFKINVDQNPDLASNYKIMSLPTLLFMKKGRVFEQLIGIPTEKELEAKINHLLS